MNENIQKSGQDYLEAIYFISQQKDEIRSIDVAKNLGVSRPSVNRALNILETKGYISKPDYGTITITDLGIKTAKAIAEKHFALTTLLCDYLGVSKETAEADACKIEHDISEETTLKLVTFLKDKTKK